jgi:anti-sigma-K factor RskA
MDRADLHDLSAAYALDALSEDEAAAYEQHLAHCGECRESVAAFREVAAELAYDTDAPEPPAGLRERILADARAEAPKVVALPRRRWAFPIAAAAAFAAGCAALGLAFWAADLSSQLDEQRAVAHLSEEAVAALARADTQRIPLEGTQGVLLVDEEDGEAWLVLSGLEQAPEAKTYEAWVIEDGNAVAAGLFPGGGPSTVVRLTQPVSEGAVVAVTVEDEGGVEQSTQDPVFVSAQAA